MLDAAATLISISSSSSPSTTDNCNSVAFAASVGRSTRRRVVTWMMIIGPDRVQGMVPELLVNSLIIPRSQKKLKILVPIREFFPQSKLEFDISFVCSQIK